MEPFGKYLKRTTNLVCFLIIFSFVACNPTPKDLRIMSFNIWVGGGKSIQETARVIVESKADIVGIQESSRDDVNTAVHIADSLGWYSYATEGSPTIISRFAITDTSTYGHGVKIQIDKERFVWMFNIHLMYCPYEPYQLNGIHYCGAPLLDTAEEAIASAKNTRGAEVAEIIRDIKEAQKEGYPLFLTGDFNEPSCLDWTEKAAKAGLCKMAVNWPSTDEFLNRANLSDSYRVLYPNEVTHPGHTWTPLPETEAYTEVLDRIDFVLYWGDIQPIKSEIVGEINPAIDIQFNNYPSDHRAIVSTFGYN